MNASTTAINYIDGFFGIAMWLPLLIMIPYLIYTYGIKYLNRI